jgi:glycosyltransferase involved in cell wall biosynthesis
VSLQIEKLKNKIKSDLYAFIKKYDIHLIIPENALTIPMNIPLGLAITEFIAETSIPTIAHHHDFYWERERFLINACQDYLDKSFPASLPAIRHVVINSLAGQQLSHRYGISNTVIPNVYDYAHPPQLASQAQSLRMEVGLKGDDLFVLQPTRVVPRKGIERAIDIVKNLQPDNPLLVISHASGDEGDEYPNRIKEYANSINVDIAWIDHLVSEDDSKKYSFADVYQAADLITFPSEYEGFGNAFLETVYFKRPIVVNRYSIYVADIEPKGFDVFYVSGFITSQLTQQIRSVLDDKERLEEMVEKNFRLAKTHFSYEVLEKKLLNLVEALAQKSELTN